MYPSGRPATPGSSGAYVMQPTCSLGRDLYAGDVFMRVAALAPRGGLHCTSNLLPIRLEANWGFPRRGVENSRPGLHAPKSQLDERRDRGGFRRLRGARATTRMKHRSYADLARVSMSAKTFAIPTTLAETERSQVFGKSSIRRRNLPEVGIRVAFTPPEPVTWKAVSY